MDVNIEFKNRRTGESKDVKVGWSWTCFLFSGFLGFPLFRRGLTQWGGIMVGLWLLSTIMGVYNAAAYVFLSVIIIGLSIFLGDKANEMTAKSYVDNGWEFVNPENDIVKMAKVNWGIAL
jgi:hypothetical protein